MISIIPMRFHRSFKPIFFDSTQMQHLVYVYCIHISLSHSHKKSLILMCYLTPRKYRNTDKNRITNRQNDSNCTGVLFRTQMTRSICRCHPLFFIHTSILFFPIDQNRCSFKNDQEQGDRFSHQIIKKNYSKCLDRMCFHMWKIKQPINRIDRKLLINRRINEIRGWGTKLRLI